MGAALNYKPNIEVVPNPEILAQRSLELFIADAEKAIKTKGVFYAATSGGDTPRRFYELLGTAAEAKTLDWGKIQLFWVDERYVPPDSRFSNYKLAADTFLNKVNIPAGNVHRILTEQVDFNVSARLYEEAIRKIFGLKEKQVPKFDLIILGMGTDGHTGSLLPNSGAIYDKENLACVVYNVDEGLYRITLPGPVLCAAAHLVVLVRGEEKAGILKKVLTYKEGEERYPIHVLWPVLDRVTWLVDKAAAKLL